MQTQWAVSFGGVIGLRYEALPVIFDLCDVPKAHRSECLDCLQIMEREAVRLFNKD